MHIAVIGGGPAGLYFSLLMKRADPSHVVDVFERNRPDDTFGWGVVFSDQTLGNLAVADPKTHQRIVDDFIHWDDIDIHFRGQVLRSGGHGFSGVLNIERGSFSAGQKYICGVFIMFAT